MEKKKIWTIVEIVLISLQALMQTLATMVVLQLNMLPDEYVAIFVVAMVLLLAATALFMFIPVKRRIRLWRRIVSCILSAVIIAGSLLVSKVVYDAHNLLNDVTGVDSTARSSYVLVLNESPAQSLKDTKNFRYGAVSKYDVDNTQQLILAIEQEIKTTINLTYYEQTTMMIDALYNKEADVIIMNGASISLLVEQTGYEDFLSRVRVLHTMSFEEKEPEKEVNRGAIDSTPFVMYISGSDTRSRFLTVGRSDVNILVVVNPVTKQILLLSTPRDYYVPNPAGKGALDKLTHCSNSGVDVSMKALGDLYDIDVDYYCRINFVGFEKLIDAIGGISVYSDQSFTAVNGISFNKGMNDLNGEEALWYVRERYNVAGGDHTRGRHQMQIIQAVFEKMTSSKTMISNYSNIIKSLEGMFATSLSTEEISSLVKMQLSDMASWNMRSYSVTGNSDYKETYSAPGQELYVIWPDENSVNHAQELCKKVMHGEILTDADMTPAK
ncbi:MAG: LCP family protein [Oscillospiraceae bacterium]|nr:LCP family protein [Oscillospiraceae bacterium]